MGSRNGIFGNNGFAESFIPLGMMQEAENPAYYTDDYAVLLPGIEEEARVHPTMKLISELVPALSTIVLRENTGELMVHASVQNSNLPLIVSWVVNIVRLVSLAYQNNSLVNQDNLNDIETLCEYFEALTSTQAFKDNYQSEEMAVTAAREHMNVIEALQRKIFISAFGETTLQEALGRAILENDCSVCWSIADQDYAVLTACSHTFCIPCAHQWLTSYSSCPLCRAMPCMAVKKSKVARFVHASAAASSNSL